MWRERLDALARDRAWIDSRHPELPDAVASLSDLYRTVRSSAFGLPDHLAAARLAFFLPRDVAKGAGAMRELLDAGLVPDRPLRILDLGAGLGAMALGVARAVLDGRAAPVAAHLVDRDPDALAIAARLAPLVPGLTVTTGAGDVAAVALDGPYDLVLLGQTLLELDADVAEDERVVRHADRLASWLRDLVADDGALVIVEPALREPSRHLHRVRDALIARGFPPFAPCTHAGTCPALARPGDWCHARADVGLPDWLVPIARAARLRGEGEAFSHLVVRPDGARSSAFRVVSEPLPSKGRHDLWLCGAFDDGPDRRKVGRINRHATATNALFPELVRGDRVEIDPVGARIGPDTVVRRVP